MGNFDPMTGEPIKKQQGASQPETEIERPTKHSDGRVSKEYRKEHWAKIFFSIDNPLWTLIPILVSLTALFFAYKSTTINREANDVHIRITTLVAAGYPVPDWNFERDGHIYCPGVVGNGEELQKTITDNPVGVAINSLHMRWGAVSQGVDLNQVDYDAIPYTQYYHYLVITNDGEQIAQDLMAIFDHYPTDDNETLRGKNFIPEGSNPEEWEFGPAPIAPGQTVLIPIGQSYVRYAPSQNEPGDLYRYFDVQYFGEFFLPHKLTYASTVSGLHEIELDLSRILPVVGAYTQPPAGPVGERAQAAVEQLQSQTSRQAEDIVQNMAPDSQGQDNTQTDQNQGDNAGTGDNGNQGGRPPKQRRGD